MPLYSSKKPPTRLWFNLIQHPLSCIVISIIQIVCPCERMLFTILTSPGIPKKVDCPKCSKIQPNSGLFQVELAWIWTWDPPMLKILLYYEQKYQCRSKFFWSKGPQKFRFQPTPKSAKQSQIAWIWTWDPPKGHFLPESQPKILQTNKCLKNSLYISFITCSVFILIYVAAYDYCLFYLIRALILVFWTNLEAFDYKYILSLCSLFYVDDFDFV